MKKLTQKTIFLAFFIFATFLGCSGENDPDTFSGYDVFNDENVLNQRLQEKDMLVNVQSTTEAAKTVANLSFSLKLVAEVEPSFINGQQVQATMVSLFGSSGRAAVSYNAQGSSYLGAVDVIQISSGNKNNIRIKSGVEFTNAKANAVFIRENALWIALSSDDISLTNDEGFSAASKFELEGFKLNETVNHTGLPGFAANSINEQEGSVYITSGDNAGLTILNDNLSEKISYREISDSRWVDTDESRIVVLGSNPSSGMGTLSIFDRDTFELINEFSFEGADTPEAKNTVEIKSDLALIAAGKSGVHLMDITNGAILSTIPIPDPESIGLSEDVVESNAVSADEEYIFISNGEAGVYVAEANIDLNEYQSGQELSVELIGNLKFDELQSVNHITYRNKNLIVAAGLGGVKFVTLTRK